MFKFCDECGNMIINKKRRKFCSNRCSNKTHKRNYNHRHWEKVKRAKREHSKKFSKRIAVAPENGRTLDVVDMMERNTERFNYGLELNR